MYWLTLLFSFALALPASAADIIKNEQGDSVFDIHVNIEAVCTDSCPASMALYRDDKPGDPFIECRQVSPGEVIQDTILVPFETANPSPIVRGRNYASTDCTGDVTAAPSEFVSNPSFNRYLLVYQATGGAGAGITSPTPGTELVGPDHTFSWDWPGNPQANWWLQVSSTQGGWDLFDQSMGTATSVNVTGLPETGQMVWVYLWHFDGSWQFEEFTYTVASSDPDPDPPPTCDCADEIQAITAERDALIIERDALTASVQTVTGERDALIVERDSANAALSTITAERDAALLQAQAQASENQALEDFIDTLGALLATRP